MIFQYLEFFGQTLESRKILSTENISMDKTLHENEIKFILTVIVLGVKYKYHTCFKQ